MEITAEKIRRIMERANQECARYRNEFISIQEWFPSIPSSAFLLENCRESHRAVQEILAELELEFSMGRRCHQLHRHFRFYLLAFIWTASVEIFSRPFASRNLVTRSLIPDAQFFGRAVRMLSLIPFLTYLVSAVSTSRRPLPPHAERIGPERSVILSG